MSKVIAAINMTLDGYCDHTAIIPDAEMHEHYTGLLNEAGVALYGRITYQLMEYWRPIADNPSGEISEDEFAKAIDKIPKIVFSHTLKNLDWNSARLAKQDLKETVTELKQQQDKAILICSPSLIVSLTNLQLIDEYQLCVHPVIAGHGLPLFKNIQDKIILNHTKTKTFNFGAVILYYESKKM
jgi:dihydrofolate reductase